MAASTVNVENVIKLLEESLCKLGFEVKPLKVGWYNHVLPASLHLSYPEDTLAVVVLSTPSMFELAFLPFLEEQSCQGLSDPIDQCVRHCVSTAVSQCFSDHTIAVRYDYELLPSRKPKFLAQTAAHVSGAAFYYQQSDVPQQPWGEKKMYGVCVHPQFGGWFAIRALLVFEDVTLDLNCSSLLLLTVSPPETTGYDYWRLSTFTGRTGLTETSSAQSKPTHRDKKTTSALDLHSCTIGHVCKLKSAKLDAQSQDPQSQDVQSQEPQTQDLQSQDPQSQDPQSHDPQSQDRQSQDRSLRTCSLSTCNLRPAVSGPAVSGPQSQDLQSQDLQSHDPQSQDLQSQDLQSQDPQSQDPQSQDLQNLQS
ncbi:hypothetical protein WMY93_024532 [Mugilogobius chulae]|uniref:Cyanocobalamin reductase / alkylcobalamin dealkylase n=1 Tax=Mugilogobius chulae TaxID=88201 RepID=A0AAW0NAW0_9GOBI